MYKLTKKGREKATAYIRELEAKRKEILDAGLDTANETELATVEAIEDDINFFDVDEDGEYFNGWPVTDNYDSDRPLGLTINEDFVENGYVPENSAKTA